ncbi:MAG: RHS repeat-associated core domain-containing protein [Planctomycetia bacterium]|nr:RHS repeat-associated core domain-containing protein [Planctomycetia bacterium]
MGTNRQPQSSLTLNNVASRTNTTTYDYLGRATSIRQHGNITDEIFAEFTHNANGLLTSINRYEIDDNNLLTSIANTLYTYNANNAVTSITHKKPDETSIVQHSYTYDSTNNILSYLNSLDGSTSYNYDFLGQLISTDYANQNLTDETYTYDENGNRLTANGSNYTTGTNNELTYDSTYTYTYDSEGNRISKTNSTYSELYTWDYRNRLTKVTQQEYNTETQEWTTTQIVEYAYDYNNVWIRKTLDTNADGTADSKSIFIPENYQTVIQLDDSNLSDEVSPTVTHHYLWTPQTQDKLLADTTTDGVLWTLTDHLGSIRDIIQQTSSSLVVPAHIIYDAYGNVISCKDSTGQTVENPILFGYTGKAFDADTQLQNNINRWYDAAIGRWLSTDPIGFNGNDTNLYRYVGNRSPQTLDILGLIDIKKYNQICAMCAKLQESGVCKEVSTAKCIETLEEVYDIAQKAWIFPYQTDTCWKWVGAFLTIFDSKLAKPSSPVTATMIHWEYYAHGGATTDHYAVKISFCQGSIVIYFDNTGWGDDIYHDFMEDQIPRDAIRR